MQRIGSSDALALRRGLAGIVAWAVFAGAWVFVLRRPGAVLLTRELLVIPASAVLVASVSALWIRHNRRIYRRKGPRRGIPADSGPPVQDRLGRPVALDLSALRGVQEVVLETTSLGKTYRSPR